ncbi:MAG: 5-dehydro-4-deoxyglucarate dehydratase [Acidobacteria bacterium]|nr:MAG: 5-dehydro-4-deoxyglucarate dehydratase [Acidobacteriota bacterium]
MALSPEELRTRLRGLFSFPVTPFTESLEIDLPRYREHVAWMAEGKPAALFVCGGTGEFFSLDLAEFQHLVKAAVDETSGRLPVIAGVGYGTQLAISFVKAAEDAGADGLLVLPPYLLLPEQQGLYEHYCRIASRSRLGLIIYQRDNAIFAPATVARLCELKNIIGFKDGHGNMELLLRIQKQAGDRLAIINGMPTAELSAAAFKGMGITNYSSAVFNFVPPIARAFYKALINNDELAMGCLLDAFYRPLADLRDRKKGYAVSLIKAGLRATGKPAGPVRPPLVNCSSEEEEKLKAIIAGGLAAVQA